MENKEFIPKDMSLLNPKVDSTFKTLFTNEGDESRVALKSLIGAIIGHKPETVEIVNNEPSKDIEDAKDIRLDLQCQMPDGERIDIEIQTSMGNDDLKNRSVYYACRMMSGIPMKGVCYEKLPKVYHIMFTDFRLFNDKKKYMQSFTVRNDEEELSDCLNLIFIQLPLFDIGKPDSKNFTDIEKWIIFLKYSNDNEKRDLLNSIMASNDGIRKAGEILMAISKDFEEWAKQEMRYKAEVDREAFRLAAHEKGLAEGRAEGLEQGKAEGRAEEKLEIARGMKAKNLPLELIAEITGLTAEQVAAL